MGKRRNTRVSEEHIEEEDEEMNEQQQFHSASSSSNQKSLYEVPKITHSIHIFFLGVLCFLP